MLEQKAETTDNGGTVKRDREGEILGRGRMGRSMTEHKKVQIREASADDLNQIGDLWEELIRFHNRLDDRFWVRAPDGRRKFLDWMHEALSDNERALFVAAESGQVVGFVHGMLKNSPPPMLDKIAGFVTDMVVSPLHRRTGIGRSLMDAVESWFRDHGAKEIKLTAALCNEDAVLFWRDIGFEPWTYTMWKPLT